MLSLTLLPASGLCLTSGCQPGMEVPATIASSGRAQGTGIRKLDVVTTTAVASSRALASASPGQVVRLYDPAVNFTQSLGNDSVGDNSGYRAVAYYVNWVSSSMATLVDITDRY